MRISANEGMDDEPNELALAFTFWICLLTVCWLIKLAIGS
jgi:hypothetical protein